MDFPGLGTTPAAEATSATKEPTQATAPTNTPATKDPSQVIPSTDGLPPGEESTTMETDQGDKAPTAVSTTTTIPEPPKEKAPHNMGNVSTEKPADQAIENPPNNNNTTTDQTHTPLKGQVGTMDQIDNAMDTDGINESEETSATDSGDEPPLKTSKTKEDANGQPTVNSVRKKKKKRKKQETQQQNENQSEMTIDQSSRRQKSSPLLIKPHSSV